MRDFPLKNGGTRGTISARGIKYYILALL